MKQYSSDLKERAAPYQRYLTDMYYWLQHKPKSIMPPDEWYIRLYFNVIGAWYVLTGRAMAIKTTKR